MLRESAEGEIIQTIYSVPGPVPGALCYLIPEPYRVGTVMVFNILQMWILKCREFK